MKKSILLTITSLFLTSLMGCATQVKIKNEELSGENDLHRDRIDRQIQGHTGMEFIESGGNHYIDRCTKSLQVPLGPRVSATQAGPCYNR